MSPVQNTVHPVLLAAGEASEHRPLIITLFAVFVAATLVITVWAGRQTKDAADFYAGGRQFTGFQNGLAVSGDYMSAASSSASPAPSPSSATTASCTPSASWRVGLSHCSWLPNP